MGSVDFSKIIAAAYAWMSFERIVWYLALFWVSLPFLIFLPAAFEQGMYSQVTLPVAYALYDILYLVLVVGLIVLIQFCLAKKKLSVAQITLHKLLDIVLLVFVELFYVLVWNVHASLRAAQILLLALVGLAYYYSLLAPSSLATTVLGIVLFGYVLIVIHNSVRSFFTTLVFASNEVGLKEAVKNAWALTHNRFYATASGISLSILIASMFLIVGTIALGTLVALVLSFFFIKGVALGVGFNLAFLFAFAPAIISYHYAITELYAQLSSHSKASASIKRILAHKVMRRPSKTPARKFRKFKKKKK